MNEPFLTTILKLTSKNDGKPSRAERLQKGCHLRRLKKKLAEAMRRGDKDDIAKIQQEISSL